MSDYAELAPEDLLERIGTSLRKEIGPAVTEAYPCLLYTSDAADDYFWV